MTSCHLPVQGGSSRSLCHLLGGGNGSDRPNSVFSEAQQRKVAGGLRSLASGPGTAALHARGSSSTAVTAAPGVSSRLGREDTFRLSNRLCEIQKNHSFFPLRLSLTQTYTHRVRPKAFNSQTYTAGQVFSLSCTLSHTY